MGGGLAWGGVVDGEGHVSHCGTPSDTSPTPGMKAAAWSWARLSPRLSTQGHSCNPELPESPEEEGTGEREGGQAGRPTGGGAGGLEGRAAPQVDWE